MKSPITFLVVYMKSLNPVEVRGQIPSKAGWSPPEGIKCSGKIRVISSWMHDFENTYIRQK